MMNIAFALCAWLVGVDARLLLFLNGLRCEWLDQPMWLVSGKWTWVPFYLFLAFVLVRREKWRGGVLCLLSIALAITFTDQTCASCIRPLVGRLRPSSPDNPLSAYVHIVNGYRGGNFGFPSCHAANSFALATFLSLRFRNGRWTALMLAWATLVSYSRIYLGVHYPGDLLAGAAVGSGYGYVFHRVYVRVVGSSLSLCQIRERLVKCWLARLLRPIAVLLIMLKPSCCHAQVESRACGAESATDSIVVSAADSIVDALQATDSLAATLADGDSARIALRLKSNPYRFKPLQLAVPGALIGVGIFGLHNKWLIHQNKSLREELQENIDSRFTIDDFTQYVPMVGAYALKLCGVRSRHGYGDMTIILGTAYALMGITVNALKVTTRIERPDGSSLNSFPSGHTATAFMGAELLRREYWDVSPWIGVAGYAVAAGTGFFRMYNNRHWLTDVIAGAGIGILSVQAAYWLYPVISKTFFRKNYLRNTYFSPYLSKESKGVTCSIRF